MKAPDKIYMPNELLSEEWQQHIEGEDTAYIRKDALLDSLKKKLNEIEIAMETGADDPELWGERNAFKQVIDKLNSM